MYEQNEQKQVDAVSVAGQNLHVFPLNIPFPKPLNLKVTSLRIGNISKECGRTMRKLQG